MTEPAIQPSQRPTTQRPAQRQESPADFVVRTMAELPSLTGGQASVRLDTIRSAIANGTLDGSHEDVRLTTRSLEQRVSEDVHGNAPMAQLAPSQRGGSSRVSRAVGQAFAGSRGESLPQQAFLDDLQSSLGGSRGLAREMTRMSPMEFKQALLDAGVNPQAANDAREYVETAIAHQFERTVQRHVIGRFEGLAGELDRSAQGSGPEFEVRLEQLSGTGGQRLMRVMQGMGIDTSELSRLVNEWGGENADRGAVVQQMRGPLQQALQEMRDVAHSELDQVRGQHFLDEPYTQYEGATQAVAREWGLPRGVLNRSPQSVVASGLHRRNAEATGEDSLSDAARSAASSKGGPLYALATLALDYGRATGGARREATMAEVGEGDPGEAIEGRARAIASVARGVGGLVVDTVLQGTMDNVNEQAVEGANRLVDAATGTARAGTGTSSMARDVLQEVTERGVGALIDAGEDAFVGVLEHQDTPLPIKAAEL